MSTPPPPQPEPESTIECPGCKGRNPPGSTECEWCGRPFGSTVEQLRPSASQLATAVLLVLVVLGLGTLVWMNGHRALPRTGAAGAPTSASSLPASAASASVPAVQAASSPSAGSAAATPSPTVPLASAHVANTAGAGVVLRSAAGPQAKPVLSLGEGTKVLLTGNKQTVGAQVWVEVQTMDGAHRGWVENSYLDTTP